MKEDPHLKELKILSRNDKGYPNMIYSKMKMTGMSERDSVLSLESFDL